MFKIILALMAITAGMAHAGNVNYVDGPDQVVVPPVQIYVVPSLFDGFYVGASVKALSSQNDFVYAIGSKYEETVNPDLSGVGYGLYAGYGRVNFNSIYKGVEVNAQMFGSADTVDCHGDCYKCSEGIDNLLNLRARLGYHTGRTLIYLHAGYSLANVTAGVAWPDGSHGQNVSGTVGGLAYGAGLEYAIGDHVKLGIDYTVNDLDDLQFSAFGRDHSASFANQEIMARVGWTF